MTEIECIRWPVELFLFHTRGGPSQYLLRYLNEKIEMGLLENAHILIPPGGSPLRTLELENVRPNVWERVLKPGIASYAKILKWDGHPSSPINVYHLLEIQMRVKNEERR